MRDDEQTMYINGDNTEGAKDESTVYIGGQQESDSGDQTVYVGRDNVTSNENIQSTDTVQNVSGAESVIESKSAQVLSNGSISEENETIIDRKIEETVNPSELIYYLPTNTMLQKRYRINTVLGEGGFGITYSGWDITLNIPVAIKEYYPSGLVTRNVTLGKTTQVVPIASAKYGNQFRDGIDRVLDEARRMAKFRNTPGIVGIYDFFEANNTAYIVMEYVDGCTLDQYCKNNRVDNMTLFNMLVPVMDALQVLHDEGIIHRDISPDNIMVDNDGNFKLLDFGAARGYSEESSTTMSVILKKSYAPEEQFRSKGVQGPWTDVYALGATIYELITGQTPPTSIDRLVEDEIVEIKNLSPALTKNQSDVIMAALAVRQKDRWQSVTEFKNALLNNSSNPVNDDWVNVEYHYDDIIEDNNNIFDKLRTALRKINGKIYGIGIGILVLLIVVVFIVKSSSNKKPDNWGIGTEFVPSSTSMQSGNEETYVSADGIMQAHLELVCNESPSYYAYIEFTNETDRDVAIQTKDIYLNGIPTDSSGRRNIGIVPANSTIILTNYIHLDVLINKGIDVIDSFQILFYLGDDVKHLYHIEESNLSITIDYMDEDLEKVNSNKLLDVSDDEDANIENEEAVDTAEDSDVVATENDTADNSRGNSDRNKSGNSC